MKVTIKMIADKAGVSRGTVDRVLNNRGKVRPEVDQRVREIAEEMGYRPNLLGRALGMNKNPITIGFIVQSAETSFIQEVINGAKEAAGEVENYGSDVLFYEIPGISASKTSEGIKELCQRGISALAIMPPDDPEVLTELQQLTVSGMPIITFNTDLETCGRISYVGQDAKNAGRTAALLMGSRYRENGGKIAVFSGTKSNRSLENRTKGFLEIMTSEYQKIEVLPTIYCREDEELAYSQMRSLLEEQSDLDGIYMTCFGETGICRALREAGKEQKIYFVGSDLMGENIDYLSEGMIDLLVGQEARKQGYEPIILLHRLLLAGERPEKEYIYTDIVIKTIYNI